MTKTNIKETKQATRDGYGRGLLQAGQQNQNVVVLTADLAKSTRSHLFKEKFPNRFFELGVAEQNLMGVAAGLAHEGKIPFVSSYAVFSPGRNWEQLRVSVCYQNLNVKLAGHHSGIQTGADGATHQGLEDIALARCLPNLTVIAPADALQAEAATIAAANHQGPVYLRFTKHPTPIITPQGDFTLGQAQVLFKGKDATLIGCGPVLSEAIQARSQLKTKNIDLEIINLHTIKPLDIDTILKSVKKTHCLITLEDHQLMGGMGSAVLEALATTYAAPVTEMLGIKDTFGESGQPRQLWQKYGLDSQSIIQAVDQAISRKKRL